MKVTPECEDELAGKVASIANNVEPPRLLDELSSGRLRRLLGSVFNLGIGEAVSRIASFLFFAFISRRFGVELLGTVALAQTVAMYVTLGTDQGLRLAGARLVARNVSAAPTIIRSVLSKRLVSCVICVTVGICYSLYGPVPTSSRPYIFGFVLAVIPYAFSLDWLAWGLDKFAWLGGFRGGVSTIFLLGSIVGIAFAKTTLFPITISNGVAAISGAVCLWVAWHGSWRKQVLHNEVSFRAQSVEAELRWGAILPLGLATIFTQAFHCFDTVLLGAMCSVSEVGRYSAAYKILFFVLGAYWLVTNSLYPKISRSVGGWHAERLLKKSLVLLAAIGLLLTFIFSLLGNAFLNLVYGSNLGALHLLRVLVFAIPMDFCVSLLGTVFVSRGRDRVVLTGTATAAGLNIVLNLLFIPRLQGMGAAITTLISYGYLLCFFLYELVRKPVFKDPMGSSPVATLQNTSPECCGSNS